MKSREQEYKEIFIAEALEYFDALNRHISDLEKRPQDDQILAEIFRFLHNLKANAKAIGYLKISDVSHKLETAFSLIRNKELSFSDEVVTVLFEGIDLLGELIHNIDNESYGEPDPVLLRNLDIIVDNLSDSTIELAKVQRYNTSKNLSLSELVYIQIKKLDHLLNLVGELVIDRDRIVSISRELGNDELKSVSSHLNRITEDLQYSIMDARLVSIGSLFNKFPRIVRDIATAEKKSVDLTMSGHDIQIDRNILQIITDSLLHLVRNAITHGIEKPENRLKKNKSQNGNLSLIARNDRENVLIQLSDDGKGIDLNQVRKAIVERQLLPAGAVEHLSDTEALSYLFEPGFSLAKEVTEFSGRGVGLDVVKNAVDSIGGRIRIESEKGKGTSFILQLPTSIAVKGALLFEVDEIFYAIPLIHTEQVVALDTDDLHEVGGVMVADIFGETITVVYLHELLNVKEQEINLGDKTRLKGLVQNIIIVSYNNRKLGLIVDKLYRQQDIVVKPLSKPLDAVDLYGGVTLLGSGKVCLVLDVPAVTRYFISRRQVLAGEQTN
ncbi:chemotaxis protein CheA [Pontibacter sp. BT310]|jgi:two-component system, chemotaxis family, sensor kinase CheA|uniref:Chemotaxis protein CheA n=1 Tax=Pontibacter populi TaxID=890055 RepID=A0ABS6XHE9_9BACT|nr:MULTISPECIES: chemotaxis protein CheA [Pontibacter]MBJ6119693.1 chemotaxis protein CheA [Pontibacter sp. BT310]MBR0572122.1 chemotaxis protein CheA [Microvirga sp. STS03]MBW3366546.1 chemotaxis protein CheA [Pontibacter populi]